VEFIRGWQRCAGSCDRSQDVINLAFAALILIIAQTINQFLGRRRRGQGENTITCPQNSGDNIFLATVMQNAGILLIFLAYEKMFCPQS